MCMYICVYLQSCAWKNSSLWGCIFRLQNLLCVFTLGCYFTKNINRSFMRSCADTWTQPESWRRGTCRRIVLIVNRTLFIFLESNLLRTRPPSTYTEPKKTKTKTKNHLSQLEKHTISKSESIETPGAPPPSFLAGRGCGCGPGGGIRTRGRGPCGGHHTAPAVTGDPKSDNRLC